MEDFTTNFYLFLSKLIGMFVLKLLLKNFALEDPGSNFAYSDINNGTVPKIHETLRGVDLEVLKVKSIYSRHISTSTW